MRPRPSPPRSKELPSIEAFGEDAPVPPRLSLADLAPRRVHAYLEYIGGGSSKFYAVTLEEEEGETWRVRFNFGRIGFPRAWGTRVEGASWPKAAQAYQALVDEKLGKGYERGGWPATLVLPDGATLDDAPDDAGADRTLFRSPARGVLPPETGGSIAGVTLPDGVLYEPEAEGGSRGEGPVIWASERPVTDVGRVWVRLAAAFPETGVWPFVIDASYGFHGFTDYLMDMPRGRHKEALTVLRRAWTEQFAYDDEAAADELAPFDKSFPGVAVPTLGARVTSIDHLVTSLIGHLGLAAVHRPADILDAVGWMGAVNQDLDPLDMTTVLRSWEHRFDAYVVGMGTDTLVLAVGRPPRDLATATAIAAEHYAFCPDNVQQGPGTIREYAQGIVGEGLWWFWWD